MAAALYACSQLQKSPNLSAHKKSPAERGLVLVLVRIAIVITGAL